ncbi:MAG: biotin/lipoyl-binding protein [Cyclobacteriaceae bacterium]|nr:biotin/lipoyl-binding protein [Cyclobacteriaceae bacterium]
MINCTVNGTIDFAIERSNGQLIVNGKPCIFDIHKISENFYHIIYDHQSLSVRIKDKEPANRQLEMLVDNNRYLVDISAPSDQILQNAGAPLLQEKPAATIYAPMPGLILDILVKENQEVKPGDPLLTLKAMKMENILKSPTSGTVKKYG